MTARERTVIVSVVLAVTVAGIAGMLWFVVPAEQDKHDACRNAGGVMFSARGGSICLRKDAVIDLAK